MGIVYIKNDECKGCGLCVASCPQKIMRISKNRLNAIGYNPVEITDMEKCIACASCARICPDVVLEVEKN